MNFTLEDWNILKRLGYRRKVNFSFGNYFVKGTSLEKALNEVIAKNICQKLQIMCPDYKIVVASNEYYVFSADLNEENIFFTASEAGITENINSSLKSIWQFLQQTYYNAETLMVEVVKMYLMDIFFNNVDRAETNWGILFSDKKRQLVALDHECFLDRGSYNDIKSFSDIKNDDFETLKQENIVYFLNHSGDFGLKLYKSFLKTFTVEYLENLLLEIEKNEKIITEEGNKDLKIDSRLKMLIIERYSKNYQIMEEIGRNYAYGRK